MLALEDAFMRIVLCLVVTLLAATPVNGHHSFAAYYFEEQTVTIEGEVLEFDYRAPHAWVHVLTTDAQGEMQKYSAEWANPRRLMADGVTRDRIKAGDRVVITGSPGRTASDRRIHLKRIQRASDGWQWNPARRGGRR
jgi:hypothetical protein